MGFLETLEAWEDVCKRTHFYLARKIFTHLGSVMGLSPMLYDRLKNVGKNPLNISCISLRLSKNFYFSYL